MNISDMPWSLIDGIHIVHRAPWELPASAIKALAGCLAIWDFAVSGITNKRLRAWMTGLRGAPYSMNQASYDLARLRRNGLIERIARTNTLPADGRRAHLRTGRHRVHDQMLYP